MEQYHLRYMHCMHLGFAPFQLEEGVEFLVSTFLDVLEGTYVQRGRWGYEY